MYWREREVREYDTAQVIGELILNGDCLVVAEGGVPYAVIFEYGTRWNEELSAVELPSGEIVPVGGTWSAGGGYYAPDTLDRFTNPAVLTRVLQCANGTDDVAVVQVE